MIKLQAPEEYWQLSPVALAELTNGCGPSGWRGMLIPDNLLGRDISIPCRIHDYRYVVGGDEDDRKIADREFNYNMLEEIEDVEDDFTLTEARRELALRYYSAVRNHGKPYFNYRESHGPISITI